jgi:hypothetical protein
MRVLVVASLLITSTPLSAAPARKPAKKAAEPAICASLASDYEGASKKLAMLKVEGIFDNSAPRATMRETQSTNIMEQARFTMDLMKNNGCKGPTAAPSADRYMSAALDCMKERATRTADAAWAKLDGKPAAISSEPPTQCEQTSWKSD